MNFPSLLVLLDDNPQCDARVNLAVRFAAVHDSHLVGIAPTGRVELPAAFGTASRYLENVDSALLDSRRHAAHRIDQFESRCRAAGVASFEAHAHEGDKAACVLHHAHCADLTIISQADPHGPAHREEMRLVEQVLMHNARPTLLLPLAGRPDTVGARVLVAWDDSHGSARATADALPLLRHADEVHVRVWRRTGESGLQAIRARLDTVHLWLKRHQVDADVQIDIADAAIGEAILATAAGLHADLIVMGTYGHSRWTERIIGGVTRTALAQSPIPLLMSH